MADTGGHGGVYISRVDAIGDDALDIQLSNGNIILLQTELILALPGFEGLREDDRILYPKTDGEAIYWRDGPCRLSIAEIMELSFAQGRQKPES